MTSTRRVTRCGWGRGTMVIVCPAAGQQQGDVEHVLGLEPEVELLDDRLGEQLHQRRRVGERGDRETADQAGGEPGHGPMSWRTAARTAGAAPSRRRLRRVQQRGRVDLRDRGGRQRLLVERGEHLLERRPRSSSTTRRTSANDSGGTWSRQALNSSTSSSGKSPSPPEMIWPSLM